MCRIAGVFDHRITTEQVIAMRDAMHRGGPDGSGYFRHPSLPLHLAHRRLALIDLSAAGQQPMHRADRYVIVYNGELYNFQELRQELQMLGAVFQTHTDTEVILQAFQTWGTDCFERFNGMYALAIWDEHLQCLTLARDHAGIKPLYYHLSEEKGFLFASEIRAFKQLHPNWPEHPDWQAAFLMFGHLPEPITTLKDVQPLEKGTWLQVQLPSLKTTAGKHFQWTFTGNITDPQEAEQRLRTTMDAAVQRHLISDAPIGLFLSGGIDSSLLTLLAQPHIGKQLKTLSITFDDATLNEAPYQQIVAAKAQVHHESFLVTETQFQEQLPDILAAMDQPSTDGINSYFISRYAHQYGLTAVLSGIGADELFGGYPSFSRAKRLETIRRLPAFLPGLAEYMKSDKLRKLGFFAYKGALAAYLFNRGAFSPAQAAALMGRRKSDMLQLLATIRLPQPQGIQDPRDGASWMETNLYMQNQLLKDSDYMSMWHGLEIRVPFLDKEIMQLAAALSPAVKYHPTIGKHLLIATYKDLLPEAVWNRKKMGFTFPFYKWMERVQAPSLGGAYTDIRRRYQEGSLHWSRYWNYLLSQDTTAIHYGA